MTSKALAEAEARIEGLLDEISSANRNIDLLQNTLKRFVFFMETYLSKLYYPIITCTSRIYLHMQTFC